MRRAYTLTELLVAVAIVGILIGMAVPAIHKVREAAMMAKSQNNLKQLCLGLHNLASAHDGRLPGTVSSNTIYKSDVFVELLPYVEQTSLYSQFADRSFRPRGFDQFRKPVSTFVNPLDRSANSPNQSAIDYYGPGTSMGGLSVSSYALNAQFFGLNPVLSLVDDGLAQTVWLTEHYGWNCNGTTFLYVLSSSNRWTPWQPPTFAHGGAIGGRPPPGDYYPITTGTPPVSQAQGNRTFQVCPRVDECDPRLPNASSPRGLQIALADGSVRLLSPSTSAHVFWSMVTPAGGEIAPLD